MNVVENLNKVRGRIEKAELGRQKTVLVAVSKLQSAEKIREVFSAGQKIFGENYLQEALRKQSQLSDLKIDWHFIGKIQKNKIRQMVGNFSLIQSVDDIEQVHKISKVAGEKKVEQQILLEVNVAGESSKGGASVNEIENLYRLSCSVEHVKVCGLMCLPPLDVSQEELRNYFRLIKKTFDSLQKLVDNENFRYLSIGTSHDYELAISEGSNMVRIGTEIFGAREAK